MHARYTVTGNAGIIRTELDLQAAEIARKYMFIEADGSHVTPGYLSSVPRTSVLVKPIASTNVCGKIIKNANQITAKRRSVTVCGATGALGSCFSTFFLLHGAANLALISSQGRSQTSHVIRSASQYSIIIELMKRDHAATNQCEPLLVRSRASACVYAS